MQKAWGLRDSMSRRDRLAAAFWYARAFWHGPGRDGQVRLNSSLLSGKKPHQYGGYGNEHGNFDGDQRERNMRVTLRQDCFCCQVVHGALHSAGSHCVYKVA